MKPAPKPQQLAFESRLERIAEEIDYFAIPVPQEITHALGTRAAVPVSARVNDSKPFLVSLYPRGEGRHGMRVKAEVRKETGIKEGDLVRVKITVRDLAAEVSLPPDLKKALRAAKLLEAFQSLPNGKVSFTLRWIDQAARPETRQKRIQSAVDEAGQKNRAGRKA